MDCLFISNLIKAIPYKLELLALINCAGIIAIAFDKSRAQKGGRRVPERVLFALAFAGGSLGIWAGMYLFHHKTQKRRFYIGVPLIAAAEAILALYLGACG